MYYNREGKEIDALEFGRLFADRSYQRLHKTLVFPSDTGFEVFIKSEDLDYCETGVRLNAPVDIEKSVIRQGILISTVWLGIDHGFGNHGLPPTIFETMVFDNVWDEVMYENRTSTEAHAAEQHREAIECVIKHVLIKLNQGA
jgi:hypothetical protein